MRKLKSEHAIGILVAWFMCVPVGVTAENIGENESQGTTISQIVTLNLEGGDLSLHVTNLQGFGSIKLEKQPQLLSTGFDGSFTVTDVRGTGEGWRLDVSSLQFSEVVPSGGFVGGAKTGYTLPVGSLMLRGLETNERIEGTSGGNPSIAWQSNTVIDGNSLATVAKAGYNEGAGKFDLTFGADALTLVVDSSTAKLDKENYPGVATPYESTVTWNLVSAP